MTEKPQNQKEWDELYVKAWGDLTRLMRDTMQMKVTKTEDIPFARLTNLCDEISRFTRNLAFYLGKGIGEKESLTNITKEIRDLEDTKLSLQQQVADLLMKKNKEESSLKSKVNLHAPQYDRFQFPTNEELLKQVIRENDPISRWQSIMITK